MLRVFVYGTLQRGRRNHDQYCRGFVSVEAATVRGRLYDLRQGYPMLVIPDNTLAIGTGNASSDVAKQIELANTPTPAATTAQHLHDTDWQSINGEILSFDDPETRLAMLDELEGFQPDGPSFYLRVLVRSEQGEVVWTYVAPDGRLPAGAKRIGQSW